ncbi:NfeD family protein [Ligilactobacillus sp. LYQ112]|uniref:NfeD family protein n=1 Tax=unclassified Ligilactobacillus TaxID=2767920 RepID=UPI003853FA1D
MNELGLTPTTLLWIWAGLAALFLIIELFTTQLVAIWFAVSSVVSLGLQVCHVSLTVQLVQFLVTGIILGVIFHPLAKHLLQRHGYHPLNTAETVIGKHGRVTVAVKDGTGRVTVAGDDWKATADHDLPVGCQVVVTALNGVTVTVEKIKQEDDK